MNPFNVSFPFVGNSSLDFFRARDHMKSDYTVVARVYHYLLPEYLPFLLLLVFLACTTGALLRTVLRDAKIPILIIMSVIGVGLGISSHYIHKAVAEIDPNFFLHMFTPVIIFTAAFDMDFYVFRKSFWQVLVLAVPGFLMNSALIGGLTYKINRYGWDWDTSMLFGIILSTTDPILSVVSLKNIGLSNIIINMITGESLCNDATTSILFDLYRDLVENVHTEIATEIFIKLTLKFFASVVFGFFSSRVVMFWLKHVFNDGIVEVILSFSMAYVIFFVAEWTGMSGVVSITILGLLLDSLSFSPGTDIFLTKFWSMMTFVAHLMIFLIVGLVIAEKTFLYMNARVLFYVVTAYLAMNLTRALVIFALSPFLSRLGYGFNWRWGAVIAWSGMRGTFTLNMALAVGQEEGLDKQQWKSTVLLHAGTISLLTLMINSTTVKRMVMALGLCDITLPKRMAMSNAIQRIIQMETHSFSLLKLDRYLADANWAMAEETIRIDYPYKVSIIILFKMKVFQCPDCERHVSFQRSPQQHGDLMEEARLRLLNAQIATYQKQYNTGILNQEAAHTLIGAAENYIDIQGKFMNIQEVKTYWESKGLLVTIKNWLLDWSYNVKEEKFRPSRNKILRMSHYAVFMDEFEDTAAVITLLNICPIIFHFIPGIKTEFHEQLKLCNYYFLSLYIIEAVMKALAMGWAYLYHHWNQFELLIVIVGIIDVIIMNVLKRIQPEYYVIKTISVFRIFRLLRILRLLKVVIPKVITLLDKQINKQLTFRYDIAKGYVQGEENISCLIEQIAGNERVYRDLKTIYDKNKQGAMKELGLIQHEYPEIVTAVKTKQAVQTVLNTAFETLKFMVSGGIVNEHEGRELHQILLLKEKQLAMLPPMIAPPTAEELLYNIVWLQNDRDRIDFIKKKAKIICFDYGDIICEEGELPRGIHLITSGMTKLHGSAPRYGVEKELYEQRHPTSLPYTDYLVTGAIIGELNCLTKQEMEFTVTCETAVQTCFISIEDLFEAFDKYLEYPSLEYKIWLKLSLDVALKTFKENLPYEDWSYKMCGQLSNVYVLDVPNHTKHDIYDGTMQYVILVHGTVQDCQLLQLFCAPCILPKTCHQVQGTAAASKLFVVRAIEPMRRKDGRKLSSICQIHAGPSRHGLCISGLSETQQVIRVMTHKHHVPGPQSRQGTRNVDVRHKYMC
ncbi:sodium/hydrogen exchanger 10-like [Sphaerodactylus townsendi]|uniref:sodium/hydrogen exchanger 10-like n=1 Tax=Sphaerodactylus townsendi TaxID=933632 RepID=UPI0020261C46|nr:sodium/hydrogen exchanger 10-like [Sphaerodactylus townsendi]